MGDQTTGQFIKGSFFSAATMANARKKVDKLIKRDFINQGFKPTGHSDGVLLELESMPIAYHDFPTLNQMVFRKQLWQKLLNDPELIARMRVAQALWGENGHRDSLEIMPSLISNKVKDFWLSEDKNNLVLGTVQVLDTPEGNIIYSLLKSGDMGISSRGWGDLVAINSGSFPEFQNAEFYSLPNMKVVDEASYIATSWDFVTVPAVGPAMLSIRQHLNRFPEARDQVQSSLRSLSRNVDYKYLGEMFRSETKKVHVIGSGARTTLASSSKFQTVTPNNWNDQELGDDDESLIDPINPKRTGSDAGKQKSKSLEVGRNGFNPISVETMGKMREGTPTVPFRKSGDEGHSGEHEIGVTGESNASPSGEALAKKKLLQQSQMGFRDKKDKSKAVSVERLSETEQRKQFDEFVVHELARKIELKNATLEL